MVIWTGMFVGLLLPGMIVGAFAGWADHQRRTGSRRSRAVRAPLLFPATVLPLRDHRGVTERATFPNPGPQNYDMNAGGGSWGATTVAICRQTGSTALLPTSGL